MSLADVLARLQARPTALPAMTVEELDATLTAKRYTGPYKVEWAQGVKRVVKLSDDIVIPLIRA